MIDYKIAHIVDNGGFRKMKIDTYEGEISTKLEDGPPPNNTPRLVKRYRRAKKLKTQVIKLEEGKAMVDIKEDLNKSLETYADSRGDITIPEQKPSLAVVIP